MNSMPSESSRPLLDWRLQRGPHTLAIKVRRSGARYQVSVGPNGRKRQIRVERCSGGRQAFQMHAAWVAAFRDAGWTSVSYGPGLEP